MSKELIAELRSAHPLDVDLGSVADEIERLQRELDDAKWDLCNYYSVSMEELEQMIAAKRSRD